uniref:Tho2 domain-containing protein n=1 Tax=Ascaris lumbricoides TaxID=6252 RepID=A0A0M3HMU9_ASCLU
MLKREEWADEVHKEKLKLDIAQDELSALQTARNSKLRTVVYVHSIDMRSVLDMTLQLIVTVLEPIGCKEFVLSFLRESITKRSMNILPKTNPTAAIIPTFMVL